jgi:tetratricopeptide (TPR) repeat protein
LGLACQQSGDLDAAETTFRQANEDGRTLEYRYQTFHAQAATYLGELLIKKGSYEEAEHFLRESENLYRQGMGDSTLSTGAIKQDLGAVYLQQKDYARAETELRKSLELLEKGLSAEHPSTLKTEVLLGLTLTREAKPTEGEVYLRKALQIQSKASSNNSDGIAFTKGALGECLLVQNRYSEAAPLLQASYSELRASHGEKDPLTVEAQQRLKLLPAAP